MENQDNASNEQNQNQNQGGFQPQSNHGGGGFQTQQPGFQNMGMQAVPNATAALVLGILSIPTCFCWFFFGVLSVALGIIAIVLSNKAVAAYQLNPQMYSSSSLSNAKAGKICGIIGLCMGALCLICTIVYWVWAVAYLGTTTGYEELFRGL